MTDSDWLIRLVFVLFAALPYVIAVAIPITVIYVAIRLAEPRKK